MVCEFLWGSLGVGVVDNPLKPFFEYSNQEPEVMNTPGCGINDAVIIAWPCRDLDWYCAHLL